MVLKHLLKVSNKGTPFTFSRILFHKVGATTQKEQPQEGELQDGNPKTPKLGHILTEMVLQICGSVALWLLNVNNQHL